MNNLGPHDLAIEFRGGWSAVKVAKSAEGLFLVVVSFIRVCEPYSSYPEQHVFDVATRTFRESKMVRELTPRDRERLTLAIAEAFGGR